MATTFTQIFKLISLSKSRQLNAYRDWFDIDAWWDTHRNSVIENWYFYQGLHKSFFRQYDGEAQTDYIKRVAEATIENHIKPVIDLIVAHLYKDEDSVKRYVKRAGEHDEDLNKWYKESVWTYQDTISFDDRKALNAIVTGYSIVKRTLIDVRTNLPFPNTADPLEKVKNGVIVKNLEDSAFCIPLPRIDEYNVMHPDEVGAILYIGEQDNFLGSMDLMSLMGRKLASTIVMQYVDNDVWLRWTKDLNSNKWIQQTMFPGTAWENRNPYRNVNIPFTVYKNNGDPFYIEGDSEVAQIKGLNMELNELGSGDKGVIGYHQSPIMVGYGGAELPNNFVRSANSHISFKTPYDKSRLEYLTWDGKLEASQKRQDQLREGISYTTGASLISRGFLKQIGQIRSGPPLKALFTSERAVMSRKFKIFGESEKSDMRADLLFWQVATGANLKYGKDLSFHIKFDEDFLGIDKLLEEEIKSLRVQSKTESIKQIMREEHPDWSEEDINKTVTEIEKTEAEAAKAKQIIKSPDSSAIKQEK